MNEAAATPAPELPPTLEGLVAAQNALLERNAAVMAGLERKLRTAIMTQGELNELVMGLHRLADIQAEMRDVAGLVGEAAAVRTLEQMRDARQAAPAPAPEPEPAPRRHRHRLPAQRNAARSLRAVRGLVPAGGLAALRHSLAAHAPAAAKVALAHPLITLATGTAAAGLITTAVVVPGGPGAGPAASASSPQAGTPGWDATATPVALPSPPQAARTATAPRLSADGASRNPLTVFTPLPPASYVPPDAPPPDPQQPQDPQQAPDGQQQAAGTLTADVSGVDLGSAYAGQVTITATGGPVSWGAVRGSDAITLDSARGTLQAGESAVIGITVSAAAQVPGGSTTLTLWPGDIRIAITWPTLPVPAADPSAAASGVPPASVPAP